MRLALNGYEWIERRLISNDKFMGQAAYLGRCIHFLKLDIAYIGGNFPRKKHISLLLP